MGGRGEWTREIVNIEAKAEFEYDPNKSRSNKEKHGIDFEEAKALWKDENRVRITSPYKEEPRELIIAKQGDNIHVAVITMRENRIRIISVRRARDYEVRIYERQKNDS
jgi:uncharacterized DUF497 family protein